MKEKDKKMKDWLKYLRRTRKMVAKDDKRRDKEIAKQLKRKKK